MTTRANARFIRAELPELERMAGAFLADARRLRNVVRTRRRVTRPAWGKPPRQA